MTSMSLQNLKTVSMARDAEERRRDNREKAMLLFAFQLLLDKGIFPIFLTCAKTNFKRHITVKYVDTAGSLAAECSLNLELYTICENIDLNSIFIEFEAYYNLRFQRYPQYFKKSVSPSGSSENLLTKLRGLSKKGPNTLGGKGGRGNGNSTESSLSTKIGKNPEAEVPSTETQFGVQGFSPGGLQLKENGLQFSCMTGEKLIKPISGLDFASDDARMFAEMIQREIVVSNLATTWNDVVGLEDAKTILQESLVYNREFEEFFGTALPPWRGLLLYGPPGTGKTLLAKAVASECGTTFFNISSATIVSKWRGDSEKIVKVLFQLARYHAPSTIFLDEFDALGSKRDTGESDAARRLKSEILQQMDGVLVETFSKDQQQRDHHPVFILAATNLPWDLDPAILRRLEKRIYVPLPNKEERRAIFHLHFSRTAERVAESSRHGRNALMYQIDLDALALATEGYSGSDLHQIVKETIIRKFRQNFANKIKKLVVVTEDVLQVIHSIPATVKNHLSEKYTAWDS
ncbi:unnamed protein product [Allacma fusca]|uniref:AAA+ ATPase domain-containing protein n=1 Tax=Allacma fusca TaxID=39272 RepID=A0A8J2PIJ7_9HEXA|nr:unnamed protein product [Allacma fusca]